MVTERTSDHSHTDQPTPLDAVKRNEVSPCVVLVNVDNTEQLTDVVDAMKTSPLLADVGTDKVEVLGNMWSDAPHSTVMEHLATLLRQHGLHSNERQMLVSHDDSLLIMQLCLAEHNKQADGDYDVATSKVIEMHRYLVRDKLDGGERGGVIDNDEYHRIRTKYDEFMKFCNLLDWMDVVRRISADIQNNESLSGHISSTSFVFCNYSPNPVEQAMIKLLAGDKPCFSAAFETSLDDSLIHNACVAFEPCVLSERLATAQGRVIATPGAATSVSQAYVERVLMSYLHLLVNSRSELALAQVFNVPERKLDHVAFTAVKREARTKRMPMYQTAVSYLMRIRLGGKGYRPHSSSPLSQHVKGLGELTDMTQKLVTIIEEDSNRASAVRRVINSIKNTIIRCRDNTLRQQSVEAVAEKLQRLAVHTLELQEQACLVSPGRDSHNGGSLVGRQTLRVIRAMVDKHACHMTTHSHADLLTDVLSSPHTPLRFPCLVSKFRSPLEVSPDSKESQSLAERMKQKLQPKPKVQAVPRFQAGMDWALPAHHVGISKEQRLEDTTIDSYVPSKTLVSAGCDSRVSKARKVLESLNDQENVCSEPCDTSADKPNANQITEKPLCYKATTNNKRKSPDVVASQSKRVKKTAAPKPSKKKSVPLQKGQKQLTAFFRV